MVPIIVRLCKMFAVGFQLQAMERTNHFVVGDCFTNMLSDWLQQSQASTSLACSKLVEALKSNVINREEIAADVKDKWGGENKDRLKTCS